VRFVHGVVRIEGAGDDLSELRGAVHDSVIAEPLGDHGDVLGAGTGGVGMGHDVDDAA